jgi:hypothetical protein
LLTRIALPETLSPTSRTERAVTRFIARSRC